MIWSVHEIYKPFTNKWQNTCIFELKLNTKISFLIFMQYFCYNFDNWYRFYSFDFQKLVSMAIRVSNLGIYKISTFPLFSLSKITLKEWI